MYFGGRRPSLLADESVRLRELGGLRKLVLRYDFKLPQPYKDKHFPARVFIFVERRGRTRYLESETIIFGD